MDVLNHSKFVVALDLGTTFSGYAFSSRSDPLTIVTKTYYHGGETVSSKLPTCVLLHKGIFDSFGYEAETKYAGLIGLNKAKNWRMFSRFKMVLHKQATLSRSTTIADTRGNDMEALPIFTMALRYLQKMARAHIKAQVGKVSKEDVTFVITVPAIWDDNAKQFMREAATKADIRASRLKLALEPEAASIWCESHSDEASIAVAGVGTRYMVADLGGGTADISVHEREAKDALREIHRASGGDWGGTNVDDKFIELLKDLYGKERMQELREKFQDDYLELLRTFEATKLAFQIDHVKFSIKLPENLCKGATPDLTKHKDKIEVTNEKLRLEARNFASLFFDDTISKIVNHLKELMKQTKLQSVRTILLVGGFAESRYLQEEVKREFREKLLIVPESPGLAVLRGAVIFGHFPLIVTSRSMRYTYGIEIHRLFDEKIHKHIKPVYNEKAKCHFIENFFNVFVSVDEEIKSDAKFTQMFEQRYGSDGTFIKIFRSTLKDPSLVTDPESEKVGTVEIRHPIDNVKINVTFMFGETELIVKARIHETGKEEVVKLDCLK